MKAEEGYVMDGTEETEEEGGTYLGEEKD